MPADAAGMRIDVWLAGALELPRAKVKELLERGAVRIGGRPPRKGDRTVAGARVEVTLQSDDPRPVPQPELPAARAPRRSAAGRGGQAGANAQPSARARASVARWSTRWWRAIPSARRHPTTRARVGWCTGWTPSPRACCSPRATSAVWRALRDAFTERRVDKRYLAVVTGPVADAGEIDLPLRHRGAHVEPALSGGGREALTDFRVLSRAGDAALLEVRIHTGVLHQIRAHLAAIGAPVLGDHDYGGRAHPGLDRFFLHAARLGLAHPVDG